VSRTTQPSRRSRAARGTLSREISALFSPGALREFRGQVALIGLIALVLRIAYTLIFVGDLHGFDDTYFYHHDAHYLANGPGFIQPLAYQVTGASVPTASHPPLWPGLLAVFSLLGLDSWTVQRLVGCVVGAVVVVLIGVLGRRVAGPRVGVFAAGVAAVYPVLITADGSLMSETLYGLFVVLALLSAYRLLERPTRANARTLGLLIGAAALSRAEGWLLLPLLAAPVCWVNRRRMPGWDRRLGIAAVAMVLVILPWTLRNWAVFNRPVVISTNGSAVIGGANCDATFKGRDIGLWRIDCLAPGPPGENEAQQASRWQRSGLGYARRHLGRGVVVATVRVMRTWDLYQPMRGRMAGEGRDVGVARAGVVVFYLLVPLALYGIALLRRRRAPLLILLAPVVMVTVTSVLGFGYPRFRHAAEIPLVVLAGLALAYLVPERHGPRGAPPPRRAVPPPRRRAPSRG
jgi:hypothetical protein